MDIGYCHSNNNSLNIPTLTSSLYDTENPHGISFAISDIFDSPENNPESNFSFIEPSIYQLESNLFDCDNTLSSFPSVNNIDDSFSNFNDDTEKSYNVKLEEPDTQVVKIENDSDSMNSLTGESCSKLLTTNHCKHSITKQEINENDDQIKNRKIFPFRLWDLVSDNNFEPLSWNSDGTMVVVNMQTINRHLVKICRTKKFASFLRQLHLYGFRKDARCLPNKRASAKIAYYQHQYFLRNDPSLLYKINRVKFN